MKPCRIRLGVSSCLIGQRVRHDGSHKLDIYIARSLSRYFELVPVCPEMAIGLGVPRPPIHLVGDTDAPRAVGVKDPALDVTTKLAAYGRRMARELNGLSGYIFKSKSPSCGIERVKIYTSTTSVTKKASGIYAHTFMTAHPLLPTEEEDRLNDPELRDNFIERIYAYRRWQNLTTSGLTAAKLIEFHTIHKLALMAHGEESYRALGRLMAQAGARNLKELADEYGRGLMSALRQRATRKRHANVLMHLLGYLKKQLNSLDKAELLQLIEIYRLGHAPIIAPITLLKHYFRRFPHSYIERQTYLYPDTDELMLRSGVI